MSFLRIICVDAACSTTFAFPMDFIKMFHVQPKSIQIFYRDGESVEYHNLTLAEVYNSEGGATRLFPHNTR